MSDGGATGDIRKIDRVFPQLRRDVKSTLLLERVELESLDITVFHVLLLIFLTGFCNYTAFIVGSLLRIRLAVFLSSILFPIGPFMGVVYMLAYSYVAACVYAFMLSDESGSVKGYMYVVLLGSVHLPAGILVVQLSEGLLSGLFGRVFHSVFFLAFGLIGLFSDSFCRRNLVRGRHFLDGMQRRNFVLVSLLLNLSAYLFIFPLFYVK